MAHIVKPGDTSQKQPICIFAVAGFWADLAMFLPRNKSEIPKPFRMLLKKHGVGPMGTDYLRKLDRKRTLTAQEREIIAEEATYYLYILLVHYYILQMTWDTDWQSNIVPTDPETENYKTAATFAHYRIAICLQALGVPDEQLIDKVSKIVRGGYGYYRADTWKSAHKNNSLYPALSKILQQKVYERMVMTDAKRALLDTYSKNLHDAVSIFFRLLQDNYRFVGIRHFEAVEAIDK